MVGLSALMLAGCSDDKASTNSSETMKENVLKKKESIKDQAKKVSYMDMLNEKVKIGTALEVEGNITYAEPSEDNTVPKDTTFTLDDKEDETAVYWVENKSDYKFKANTDVKVYGTYKGLEETTGIPLIEGLQVEASEGAITGDEENGEFQERDFGNLRVVGVGYNNEIALDGSDAPLKPIQFGDVNLYINRLHVLDIEPTEDSKSFFNDQDKIRAVAIDMKVENTSDKDISFYPENSIIVTDTGEQIESEIFTTDEIGGDFFGKVTKEGQVWYFIKDMQNDVKNIKIIISPPYLIETDSDIGKEKRLDFEILNWKDAQNRDGES